MDQSTHALQSDIVAYLQFQMQNDPQWQTKIYALFNEPNCGLADNSFAANDCTGASLCAVLCHKFYDAVKFVSPLFHGAPVPHLAQGSGMYS